MQISVMKCPHQCQVKPVKAGQVSLIREAKSGEDELDRGTETEGRGEESTGPSGTRGRGSRGEYRS